MTDVWGERAQAYRDSVTHATDADLDTVVEMCDPHEGVKVLDVATGGGHVARRLREQGGEVVTTDASPGMRPDVVCRAEDLPFADGSFDVVVSRIAPHHFERIDAAVAEMARVSSSGVVVEDTLYTSRERRAGGAAPRPDARAQPHRGRVARPLHSRRARGGARRALRRRRTTSRTGWPAPVAAVTTRRACASCWPR